MLPYTRWLVYKKLSLHIPFKKNYVLVMLMLDVTKVQTTEWLKIFLCKLLQVDIFYFSVFH